MFGQCLVSSLVICAAAGAQHPGPSADPWRQHMDLGRQLESRGQYAAAEGEFQVALRAASQHGNNAKGFLSRVELGNTAAAMGQYIEAEEWDNAAVRLGIELYGKEAAELAVPFTNLAALSRDQGAYDRAEEYCRRALRLVVVHATEPTAAQAHVLGMLGGILSRRAKFAEAEASLQQSIQIAQKLPAASAILAGDWTNLASVYAQTARQAEALALYRQAYALYQKISNPNDPNLFFTLAGMAAVEANTGKYSDAIDTIESGIRLAEAGGAANTMLVRDALVAEADWLHKLKREPEAKRVRARAKQIGKTAIQNSSVQYTVDARQAAHGIVSPSDSGNSENH